MEITFSCDLRHTKVACALLQRAAAESRRKLDRRLDERTADQLGLRTTAGQGDATKTVLQ